VSRYAAAAKAAGFTIGPTEWAPAPDAGLSVYRCQFKCVCGKTEYAAVVLPATDPQPDMARELFYSGAFSIKHLLKDGYTAEQAAEITKHFEGLS